MSIHIKRLRNKSIPKRAVAGGTNGGPTMEAVITSIVQRMAVSGDITGYLPDTIRVQGLQGVGISTSTPSAGDTMVKVGSLWVPKKLPITSLDPAGASTGNAIIFNGSNIAWGAAGVSGSGTTGTLVKWITSSTVGDSIASESGGQLNVAGVTQVTANTSGAALGATNTRTGATGGRALECSIVDTLNPEDAFKAQTNGTGHAAFINGRLRVNSPGVAANKLLFSKDGTGSLEYRFPRMHIEGLYWYGHHCDGFVTAATSGVTTGGLLYTDGANTGAGVSVSTGDQTHPGIYQVSTGTATGRGALRTPATAYRFGNGEHAFDCLIQIPTLSTALQRYLLCIGYGIVINGHPSRGAYFAYQDSVSPNWYTYTADNSVSTATDLGGTYAVAATTWYRLTIVVDATGSNVYFYINGVLVRQETATIPTGAGREVGITCFVTQSVGTTARTFLCDWYQGYYLP